MILWTQGIYSLCGGGATPDDSLRMREPLITHPCGSALTAGWAVSTDPDHSRFLPALPIVRGCNAAFILERKRKRNIASDIAPEWDANQVKSK